MSVRLTGDVRSPCFVALLSLLTSSAVWAQGSSAFVVATIAGTGDSGFSGDGGPAIAAQLVSPGGLAVDHNGVIYVADSGNNRIRRITPSGIISTLAGTGAYGVSTGDGGPAIKAGLANPTGIAVDLTGSVYIAGGGSIRRITPDGIIQTVAAGIAGQYISTDI